MYNGIGLQTPRGSGTNGHVQRNWAFVRPGKKDNVIYKTEDDISKLDSTLNRQPNQEILDHERKRKIEVKCAEFEEILEKHGYDQQSIKAKIDAYRTKLLGQGKGEPTRDEFGRVCVRETHQIAEAQLEKNAKLREAFGISEYFVEGTSFNPDRNANEALAKNSALQQELQAQREAENVKNRKYTLVRTPSPEKTTETIKDNVEKKKKKRKYRNISSPEGKKDKQKRSKKHKKDRSKKKKSKKEKCEILDMDSADDGNTSESSHAGDEQNEKHKKIKKKVKRAKKRKHQSSSNESRSSSQRPRNSPIEYSQKSRNNERLSRIDKNRKKLTENSSSQREVVSRKRTQCHDKKQSRKARSSHRSISKKCFRKESASPQTKERSRSASKQKPSISEQRLNSSKREKNNKELNDSNSKRDKKDLQKEYEVRSPSKSRSPMKKRETNRRSNYIRIRSLSNEPRISYKSRSRERRQSPDSHRDAGLHPLLRHKECIGSHKSEANTSFDRIKKYHNDYSSTESKEANRDSSSRKYVNPFKTESKNRSRSRSESRFQSRKNDGESSYRRYENRNQKKRERSLSPSLRSGFGKDYLKTFSTIKQNKGDVKTSSSKNDNDLRGAERYENESNMEKQKDLLLLQDQNCSRDMFKLRSGNTSHYASKHQIKDSTHAERSHESSSSKGHQTFCNQLKDKNSTSDEICRDNFSNVKKYSENSERRENDIITIQKNDTVHTSSSESSELSYSPARRNPERYCVILEEIKRDTEKKLKKTISQKKNELSLSSSRRKGHLRPKNKNCFALKPHPIVRLHSPNESDESDSGNEVRSRNVEKFIEAIVNENNSDYQDKLDKEMQMLEALKSGIAAKAREKIKTIENMATEPVASTSLPLKDGNLVETNVGKVASSTAVVAAAAAATTVKQRQSRSRSPSRHSSRRTIGSRSRSESSYSTSSSSSRNSLRSRSASFASSHFTRASHSRSLSASSNDRSKSRSHSATRSPSIPRRRGSPSFLDRRRITSARKRPIPYHRQTPSVSSRESTCRSQESWPRSPLPISSKSQSPENIF